MKKVRKVSHGYRRVVALSLVTTLALAPLDVRAMEGDGVTEDAPLINAGGRRSITISSPRELEGEAGDIEKQLTARRRSQTSAQIAMERSDNCWMVFYHLSAEWFGLLSLVTTVSVPVLTGLSHYENLSPTWQNNFGFASYFVSALAICFASLVVKTQVAAKRKEEESASENEALRVRLGEIQEQLNKVQQTKILRDVPE